IAILSPEVLINRKKEADQEITTNHPSFNIVFHFLSPPTAKLTKSINRPTISMKPIKGRPKNATITMTTIIPARKRMTLLLHSFHAVSYNFVLKFLGLANDIKFVF